MKEHARNAGLERLKRSATGCYSAWPGTISYRRPQMKKSANVIVFKGRVSPSRRPLFCCYSMH